jgi:hypothetical protein
MKAMKKFLAVLLSTIVALGLILGTVVFMIERGIPPFQNIGIKDLPIKELPSR